MIFHTTIVKNCAVTKTVDLNVPVGGLIRGIQYEGARPQSVTFTKAEFIHILKEKDYAMDIICALGDTK